MRAPRQAAAGEDVEKQLVYFRAELRLVEGHRADCAHHAHHRAHCAHRVAAAEEGYLGEASEHVADRAPGAAVRANARLGAQVVASGAAAPATLRGESLDSQLSSELPERQLVKLVFGLPCLRLSLRSPLLLCRDSCNYCDRD